MKNELVARFEEYFPDMGSPVKDEEILIFLDKNYQNKFDRKIFNEIKDQATSEEGRALTPQSFAETYFTAYKQLRTSEEQARREIDSLREMRRVVGGGGRSRPENFGDPRIGESESQPKASGGTFEFQNSIQVSGVLDHEAGVGETEGEQLMVVEFLPLNLHAFPPEYLNDHSIQTAFGRPDQATFTSTTASTRRRTPRSSCATTSSRRSASSSSRLSTTKTASKWPPTTSPSSRTRPSPIASR